MTAALIAGIVVACVALFVLGYRCGLTDGAEMERHAREVNRLLGDRQL